MTMHTHSKNDTSKSFHSPSRSTVKKPFFGSAPVAGVDSFFGAASSSNATFIQAKCAACDNEEHINRKTENDIAPEEELLNGQAIQAKLSIGAADDPLEREADNVADHILRSPDPGIKNNNGADLKVNNVIQAKYGQNHTRQSQPTTQTQINRKPASSSTSLPDSVRDYMEPRFGYDFSEVNIRVNSDLAPRINARAFTMGSNIHFAPGEFKPNTHEGKHLIGHELTHTIQQGAVPPLGANTQSTPQVSRSSPAIQREVGLDLVESSSNVLSRIESRVAQADRHTDIIVPTIRNLLEAFPDLDIPEELREGIENEEQFRVVIGGLVRMIELALEFNPGAGRDSPLNRFVYTCNCGWIDMGHFFFSAAAAYAAGVLSRIPGLLPDQVASLGRTNISLVLGWFMEYLQEGFRQFYTGPFGSILNSAPNSVRDAVMGNVRSAFTVEDLPSDAFGAQVGSQAFAAPFVTQAFGLDLEDSNEMEMFDIHNRMNEFFSDCRDVFPTGQTRRAMVEETLGHPVDRQDILPRQHFSTEPVRLTTALGLCPVPETECPPVDERGWEQSNSAGRVDESTSETDLWNLGVNSSVLKAEHQARLQQAASTLPSQAMIMVEGFASCTGSSSLNARLARSRAESATTFLRGLRPDLRIGMNYFGESRPNPAVSPGDGEAMARNRHIKIYVIDVPRGALGLPAFQLPGQTALPGNASPGGQTPQDPATTE